MCPGVNDGAVLDDTLAGVLDQYPELASVAVVPLGVSRFNPEPAMRLHTQDEAAAVVDIVHDVAGDVPRRSSAGGWCSPPTSTTCSPAVPFPAAEDYEGFPMHEDGIGMARTFELEFTGAVAEPTGVQTGFFAWVDGAPAAGLPGAAQPGRRHRPARLRPDGGRSRLRWLGDRARSAPWRSPSRPAGVRRSASSPVRYGAEVLGPLVAGLARDDVRVIPVANEFFGGNTAVTGLMVGADLARVLADEPDGHRYLLPDVCLSEGRFLDGTTPADLPRPVEIVPTDGIALRRALEAA